MAKKSFTVADYLLTRLHQAGLDWVFAVPGDYCAHFLEALLAFKHIQYVGTVTELGAGYAADGYGRFKGIGAACVQYGVGAFSALNAVAGSFVERVPIVLISASPSTSDRVITRRNGVLFHHSTGDLLADRDVFTHVTVASEVIANAAEAPVKIDGALRAALTHRRPIYLEAWSDVWGDPCAKPQGRLAPIPPHSDPSALAAAVEATVDCLDRAELPVIWAGVQIQRYGLQAALLELVKATGFPFTTTSLGKTVLDETHPQFIGTYAGPASLPSTREVMKTADCILALGTIITDDYLGIIQQSYGRMILSDDEQMRIGHQFYQEVQFQDILVRLLKAIQSNAKFPRKPRLPVKSLPLPPKPKPSDPLTYHSFFAALHQFLVDNRLLDRIEWILGESSSLYVAGNLMGLPKESFVGEAAWGSLGHETGCALGVAMATGKRPFVVAGDGGFMMQCQELSVLARQRIPAVIFVMSNRVYAIEQAFVNLNAFKPDGSFALFDTLPKWDYPALARAFGIKGHRVQTVQELLDVVERLNDDGETLWYHDHAVGVTANNVYAGLAGFYLLRNPSLEASLNLPSGKYEIPLVIQDRDIQTNSVVPSLLFDCTTNAPYHYLAVVNGKVTPYLEVEPRPYRFRILNGANFRTFGLTLSVSPTNGPPTNNTPPFIVIGNEDGFLPKSIQIASLNNPGGLTLMPGERVDLIVDFTNYRSNYLTMVNALNNANPGNGPFITNLMQFRVAGTNTSPSAPIPTNLLPNWVTTSNMVAAAGTNVQIVTLDLANESPFPGAPFVSSNGLPHALLNMSFFDDAITEKPRAGQTQIWAFVNLSRDPHPMHIHLLDFRVVDRQRFAGWNGVLTNAPTGVTNFINDRSSNLLKNLTYATLTNKYLSTLASDFQAAKPFESGPKDVVHAAPYAVTRIVMVWPTNEIFRTPSARDLDPSTAGRYVYHCHLLEHEDNDMMRPLQLLGPASFSLQAIFDTTVNISGKNPLLLRLDTIPGETYQIESSLDLSPASWRTLSLNNITGTGGFFEFTPPAATEPFRFYRARRINPP